VSIVVYDEVILKVSFLNCHYFRGRKKIIRTPNEIEDGIVDRKIYEGDKNWL